MYFGEPYVIEAVTPITVYQPTIGDIVRMGEKKFYSTLNIFVTNTTAYRLLLWDAGMDWNEISDFDLFCILYPQIDADVAHLLFKDIDFSKLSIYEKTLEDKKEKILYDAESQIEINEDVYQHISQYLQEVFNTHPEEKITHDKTMKEWFINSDRREAANAEYKRERGDKQESASMQALISACVNHPGFKHKLSELKDVGVCEFYDSVQRLQVYENTTALLKGMYSGMIDAKNINANEYNFMKEI